LKRTNDKLDLLLEECDRSGFNETASEHYKAASNFANTRKRVNDKESTLSNQPLE